MERKKENSKANKPIREEDAIERNNLPYDPNINRDDLQALQDKENSMDQGRDQFLQERENPVDFAAEDLDIPGRDEEDTSHEGTALPDEENFQYNERGAPQDKKNKDEQPDPDSIIP